MFRISAGESGPRARSRIRFAASWTPTLVESLEPELAGIAHAACFRPPMVARPGELPRDSQLLPLADDLGLRHPDERRPNLDDVAFDASFRTEPDDLSEGRIVFRAAVDV